MKQRLKRSERIFLLLILMRYIGKSNGNWTYTDQDSWNDKFPRCGKGKSQSPILIPSFTNYKFTYYSQIFDVFTKDLKFVHFNIPCDVTVNILKNNLEMILCQKKRNLRPRIENGNLGCDEYFLDKIHFHWSDQDGVSGSEHMFEGQTFDGEIQIYGFNEEYSGIDEAFEAENGVLALAIVFEVDPKAKNQWLTSFAKLLNNSKNVKSEKTFSNVQKIRMKSLLPEDTEDFVHYKGSLTTPPCTEPVTWIVLRSPLKVPKSFLESLRAFFPNTKNNSRNVQQSEQKMYFRHTDEDPFSNMNKGKNEKKLLLRNTTYDLLMSDYIPFIDVHEEPFCYKPAECERNHLTWSDLYPQCSMGFQSPIDLPEDGVDVKTGVFLYFSPNLEEKVSMPLVNDGVDIYVHYSELSPCWELQDPESNDIYRLSRIRILTGSRVNRGADHSIRGYQFPFELQFITLNMKYRNLTEALSKHDGVLIISKVFEIVVSYEAVNKIESKEIEKLIPAIRSSRLALAENGIQKVLVGWSLSPNNLIGSYHSYYIYRGSIPHPPCTTGVKWIVIGEPGKILLEQFVLAVGNNLFDKTVKKDEYLGTDNHRPLQPIKNRHISLCLMHMMGKSSYEATPGETFNYHYWTKGNNANVSFSLLRVFSLFILFYNGVRVPSYLALLCTNIYT